MWAAAISRGPWIFCLLNPWFHTYIPAGCSLCFVLGTDLLSPFLQMLPASWKGRLCSEIHSGRQMPSSGLFPEMSLAAATSLKPWSVVKLWLDPATHVTHVPKHCSSSDVQESPVTSV